MLKDVKKTEKIQPFLFKVIGAASAHPGVADPVAEGDAAAPQLLGAAAHPAHLTHLPAT